MREGMSLSRDEVVRIIGPADDRTIAQVIGTGATPEELEQARAWVVNDEAMMNAGRPLATGRVAQLIDILERVEEEALGADEP
jgi:hypothetical protein